MQSAAHYEVPVSEMILLENTDVITSSGWNNNGNGNTPSRKSRATVAIRIKKRGCPLARH